MPNQPSPVEAAEKAIRQRDAFRFACDCWRKAYVEYHRCLSCHSVVAMTYGDTPSLYGICPACRTAVLGSEAGERIDPEAEILRLSTVLNEVRDRLTSILNRGKAAPHHDSD